MTEILGTHLKSRSALKSIIESINNGTPIDKVKPEFNVLLSQLGIKEFALIENELLEQGLPREKLEKLCDVHASLIPNFKFKSENIENIPGHPVHTFIQENKATLKLLDEINGEISNQNNNCSFNNSDLKVKINLLFDIEKHFERKEMLLFPLLEEKGFDGPSKVMWGIHDKIRNHLKELKQILDEIGLKTFEDFVKCFRSIENDIKNLIFKEEQILFPTSSKMLTESDWFSIEKESLNYGYCLYTPQESWQPEALISGQNLLDLNFSNNQNLNKEFVTLLTGVFTIQQLNLLFVNLPIGITLIDEDDKVKFYSHGRNKIFNRTNSIIGRKVQNCHPPGSIHVVNKILDDFKNGTRKQVDFWIKHKEEFIYISFYSLFDKENNYKGAFEFVQNATYIRGLVGEKRIDS